MSEFPYVLGTVENDLIIANVSVYDLWESIAASKYPMHIDPGTCTKEITPTVRKLAASPVGAGHDNWLMGVRIAFDITMTAKCLIEAERYHFWDIVSLNCRRLAG